MLTTENIQQLKKEWYSFEDIQSVIRGLENSEKWEFLSEEVLWDTIYSEINNNIKQAQWIS